MNKTRLLILTLILVMLAGLLPAGAESSGYTKLTDPHSMDEWVEFFGPEVTDTGYAGGIWADKSVFLSSQDFAGVTGYTPTYDLDERGFFVALSATAASKSIVGYSTIPTDTMFILDMSSSMYGSGQQHRTVEAMANAANTAIDSLQTLNRHNRVGVAIYYGGDSLVNSSSDNQKYLTMLPLDRYQAGKDGKYITHNGTGDSFSGIKVADNVKTESGTAVSKSHRTPSVAGTYTQLGINAALAEFLKADTTVPADAPLQAGAERMPIFVLMSDGEPTAASTNFQTPGTSEMGNNYTGNRNPAESDFATQLTAALAKAKADVHYEKHTPLFYTLSLGEDISEDVMKGSSASSSFTPTIKGYWQTLISGNKVSKTVASYTANSHADSSKTSHTVTFSRLDSVKVDGQEIGPFPSSMEQQDYVDQHFVASTAAQLTDAFNAIVEEIDIQSRYVPTWINEDGQNLSGYLEFYDTISKYMHIRGVRGILLNGKLYSGANFASTLTTQMGTVDNPTELGTAFLAAVRTRLGLDKTAALQLVTNAFDHKQLYYENDASYSNYIGWFASADKRCLGFWDGQPITDSTVVPEGAAYAVKGYGVLGEGDDTSMLYSAIDVCYALGHEDSIHERGETVVVWDIPASLIPLTTYSVTLDKDAFDDHGLIAGKKAKVTLDEKTPICLVYEVALRDEITPATVADIVGSASDPDAFRIENGQYTFFTNKFNQADVDVKHDYPMLHLNASAYFEPSLENERYYFTESSEVYVKNGSGYELYKGSSAPDPNGEYYREYPVFEWAASSAATHDATIRLRYDAISSASLQQAQPAGDGSWYIPKDTIFRSLGNYRHAKKDNTTGTLTYGHYLDVEQHADNDRYYAVFALGNNGSITLRGAADLTITKSFTGDTDELTDAYKNALTFSVTGPGGFAQTIAYSEFTNGSYTLENIMPGEYTVTENNAALDGYEVVTSYSTDGGRITLEDSGAGTVAVSNDYDRQEGELIIEKLFAGDALTSEQRNAITFTVEGPSDFGTKTVTYGDFTDGSYSFGVVPLGTYTITETNADFEDYERTTTSTTVVEPMVRLMADSAAAAADFSTTVEVKDDYGFTEIITNTYNKLEADLTITKTFAGDLTAVTEAIMDGVTFTLTGPSYPSGATVTYADFTNGSYTFTGLKLGEYTVVESGTAVEHYDVTTIYTVDGKEGSSVILDDADHPVMQITNTYVPQPGNMKVSKFFGEGDLTAADFPDGIAVTITAVNGGQTCSATLNADNGWTHTFTGLEPGDYTLTEASPHDENYYTLNAVFTGVNEGTENEVTVLPGTTRVTEVSITNTYSLGEAHELRIPFRKQVLQGEGGNTDPVGETTFYFTLDLQLAEPMLLRSANTVQPGELEVHYLGDIEPSDLPMYDFMTTVSGAGVNDGWIVIRANAYDLQRLTVTITESELGMLDRWTYEAGPEYAWTVTARQLENGRFVPVITSADGEAASIVLFTNRYTETSKVPPTGDDSRLMLWALLMAVSAAGIVLLLKRSARRSS